MSATVANGSATAFSFNITGGGALFQLGPTVNTAQRSRLGIQSVDTGHFGSSAGQLYQLGNGYSAALAKDPTTASQIVAQAISSIATLAVNGRPSKRPPSSRTSTR